MLGIVGAALLGLGATYFLWPTAEPELRAQSEMNCWGVGLCADDCSQRCPDDLKKFPCMLDCASRCEARGCPGAAERHGALASCAKKRCLLRCLGGPSADCKSCTTQSCAEQSRTCQKHRCPDGRKQQARK